MSVFIREQLKKIDRKEKRSEEGHIEVLFRETAIKSYSKTEELKRFSDFFHMKSILRRKPLTLK